MYRKLTSEAGLYNNVYNDINGKYNNKMIQGHTLNTQTSLVSLVHYASHMLICNRWQLIDLNTDGKNIHSITLF